MDARRQRAAWAAVTVGGVLVVFAPVVAGLRTLSQRDTDRLYAPVRTLVVEELRAGRLPLWDPYEGTGKPLFAEGVHSVLHPISLLGAALAPSSIDFLVLAYLVSAALGAFALARVLGAALPGCAGAGLAFALSGYSVSMAGNLVFLAGLSTLPWVVAAARTAGTKAGWGTVATALATASAFLSGDAQSALVGIALGALLAADAGGSRGAVRALAGMVAGVLLAGVQIVPTYVLLPLTYRGLDLSDFQKTQWALSPWRLVEWILPGLLRGPLDTLPVGASGRRLDDPVFAESVYLGAPLVIAAALGVIARREGTRRRTALLLGVAAIALLWLALGHRLGSRQLLGWVPVWSQFRYSEKLMAPLGLCLSALGALGVSAFGAARLPTAWRRLLVAAASTSGAALLVLLLTPDATRALSIRLLGDPGPFYRSTLAGGLPHLVVGLVALLAADRLHRERARAFAIAVLLALAPAAAVFHGAHLGSPEARRIATPLRLGTGSPTPRVAHPVTGLYDPREHPDHVDAAARAAAIVLLPAQNVVSRVDTVEPYTGFEPRRLTELSAAFETAWARGFRRFGVTHVVIPLPHDDAPVAARAVDGGTLVQRDERLGFELWAVPHRPWAFFASRTVAAASPEGAKAAVLDLVAREDDGTVVVEAPEPPATAPGRVLRVERGTESLRLEAEAEDAALLVVQDAWWPGWRASVDGRPAEILAADYLVRAVPWPPGRHRLELTYDPQELRIGLAVSLVGALFVVLLSVLAARSRNAAAVR